MDWFPWYPALYRADTLDLTLEQDGAYRRLIDHYMETRLPLPDNDNSLARIIGISINEFQAIAEQVRSKFIAKGQHLHSKRCDIELDRQDNKSLKRSNAAKAAHEKRKKNNAVHATAQQTHSKCSDRGEERRGEEKEEGITSELDLAVDSYNSLAIEIGLSKCQKLTAPRKSKLKARLKEAGGIDGWMAALDKVRSSSFLCGGKTEWKANFDFILQESSFVKIMEGAYDNVAPTPGGGGQSNAINDAFDEAAQRLREGTP